VFSGVLVFSVEKIALMHKKEGYMPIFNKKIFPLPVSTVGYRGTHPTSLASLPAKEEGFGC